MGGSDGVITVLSALALPTMPAEWLVPEREGMSVIFKDESGSVFHTYSTYLDLVPKGRDEGDRGQFWVRRHDEYAG